MGGTKICAQQPRPHSPTGRIVKGCVRELSLARVSCILMYVYVAPPTPVGAWSMALGLRQRFEYYYYYVLSVYKDMDQE